MKHDWQRWRVKIFWWEENGSMAGRMLGLPQCSSIVKQRNTYTQWATLNVHCKFFDSFDRKSKQFNKPIIVYSNVINVKLYILYKFHNMKILQQCMQTHNSNLQIYWSRSPAANANISSKYKSKKNVNRIYTFSHVHGRTIQTSETQKTYNS